MVSFGEGIARAVIVYISQQYDFDVGAVFSGVCDYVQKSSDICARTVNIRTDKEFHKQFSFHFHKKYSTRLCHSQKMMKNCKDFAVKLRSQLLRG